MKLSNLIVRTVFCVFSFLIIKYCTFPLFTLVLDTVMPIGNSVSMDPPTKHAVNNVTTEIIVWSHLKYKAKSHSGEEMGNIV